MVSPKTVPEGGAVGRRPATVATGQAFVGSIRAVDRMIWTAIGNTTNLAARLQALTRELDAAVVIDDATWVKVRDTRFEKYEDVPIRERRERAVVWALRLARVNDG